MKLSRFFSVLLALLIACPCFATQSYYTPFTVQAAQVPSTQTDFPVLILVTDNRFKTIANSGHVAGANGYDIRPYSDSSLSTALTFELVTYDGSTGALEMWVKIPSLSDGYVLYLGYGDAALNSDGSSTSTWSNSFQGVWHLKEASASSRADSTSNGNTATVTGTVTQADAKIRKGISTSGSGNYLNAGNGSSLQTTGTQVTISVWINASSFPNTFPRVVAKGVNSGASPFMDYGIYMAGAAFNQPSMWVAGSEKQSATTLSASTDYYLVGTYDGTNIKIYVNAGAPDSFSFSGNITNNTSTLTIANDIFYSTQFLGVIDEARVAFTPRSADWITTEYHNQSNWSSFFSTGTEQTVGGVKRLTVLGAG